MTHFYVQDELLQCKWKHVSKIIITQYNLQKNKVISEKQLFGDVQTVCY